MQRLAQQQGEVPRSQHDARVHGAAVAARPRPLSWRLMLLPARRMQMLLGQEQLQGRRLLQQAVPLVPAAVAPLARPQWAAMAVAAVGTEVALPVPAQACRGAVPRRHAPIGLTVPQRQLLLLQAHLHLRLPLARMMMAVLPLGLVQGLVRERGQGQGRVLQSDGGQMSRERLLLKCCTALQSVPKRERRVSRSLL